MTESVKGRTNREWVSTDEHRNNWDRIFGKKEETNPDSIDVPAKDVSDSAPKKESVDPGGYFSATLQCQSCGHEWEDMILRSEKDNPQEACPKCREGGVKRKFEVPTVMRESYAAGLVYRNQGHQDMKHAIRMDAEAARTSDPADKAALKAESKRLRKPR